MGSITKEKLEKERFKEVNSQDLMQSAVIIYHSESLLEMQLMCLLTFMFYFPPINYGPNYYVNEESARKSNYIMYVMIGEHIFAYFSGIFRDWEIKHYGKLDINGVARAQKETFLKTLEVFIDCMIFGYTMNHIMTMSWKDF